MVGRTMLLGSLAAVITAGTSPTAPPKTTYQLESRVEQTITVPGQPAQTNVLTQLAVFTVSLEDSVGGQVMHVVIDSIAVESAAAPPASELAKLRGAWLHGFVDPQNRTTVVATSDDSSEVLTQIRATLTTFLPRLKPGLKQGDTWSDTTVVDSKSPAQNTKSQVVTSYSAGAQETVAGTSARHIDAQFTATTSGIIQNPMAGPMTLESTETGTSVLYVGPDGRFLGGKTTGKGNAKLSVSMMPDPIPVTTSRTSTTTVVK
jgi:hypothetical protein